MAETVASSCAKGWGALVLLGFLSVLFGILMMMYPDITAMVVLTLIGILIIVMGVIGLVFAMLTPAGEGRSTLLLLGGVLGVLIGVGFIMYPAIAGSVLTWMIGILVFFIGLLQIVFGLEEKYQPGRWLYVLAGIISIIFAILIMIFPVIGELIIFGYLVAIYFFINGILLMTIGYHMHRACREFPA